MLLLLTAVVILVGHVLIEETVNVDDEKERVELGVALHKLISCTFLTLHEAYHGGVNSQPQ